MGLLGSLLKTAIHITTAPIDILKDAATLGGTLTDEDEPYIAQKAKKIKSDIEDIGDKIGEL